MKSTITITAVVLAHAVPIALIVGGCKSQSGYENKTDTTGIYSGQMSPPTPSGHTTPVPAHATPVPTTEKPQPAAHTTVLVEHRPLPPFNEPAPPPPEVSPPPVVPPPPVPAGDGKVYIVKKNESLWIIARRNGITTKELAAANGLNENAVIHPKQKLILPTKKNAVPVDATSGNSAVLNGEAVVHEVKSGDTLDVIAKTHGSSVAKIKAANKLSKADEKRLRIGKKLIVPIGGKTTPGSAGRPADARQPSHTPGNVPVPVIPTDNTNAGGFFQLGDTPSSVVTATPQPEDRPADASSSPANNGEPVPRFSN
ncbi:MAG: LysM peptidoglycan-binding domain-containing protein [Puniceicoccales bacterium]|jgi:LysM repeat protein|nr:LysM peptidoglycan-binding domain-containing protein [Puniceicoccales bacterium]